MSRVPFLLGTLAALYFLLDRSGSSQAAVALTLGGGFVALVIMGLAEA